MGSTKRGTNSNRHGSFHICRGCVQDGSNYDRLLLCLGLINGALLIVAVTLGIKCVTVKQGSDQVSHTAASQLISKLEYLRSRHSNMTKTEEEAKKQLQKVLSDHPNLKLQLEHQKAINEGYQKQIEELQSEKALLQSNMSALGDTCGKCLPGWKIFNSSCYLFAVNVNGRLNWKESRDDCIHRGGDLAVIDNPEEEIFLRNTISLFSNRLHSPFWMGISYVEKAAAFVWLNNVTQNITRESDQTYGYRDYCGSFVRSLSPRRCRETCNWICEMQPNQSVDVLPM